MSKNELSKNGWKILAHPLFLEQLKNLLVQVENLKQKFPEDYKNKKATKRLAAILKLIEDISKDPANKNYRQGNTLGDKHKIWFRAKFFQQYRLFFRFDSESKTIVFVWVNDENSKRSYNSNDDAYLIFKRMLDSGNPPNDWSDLQQQAESKNSELTKLLSNKFSEE